MACNCKGHIPSASRSIKRRASRIFSILSTRGDARSISVQCGATICSELLLRVASSQYSGAKGKILNGWAVSGITQFQTGFPIHLQSFDDNELTSSIDFASAGEPDQIARFHKLDPRKNANNYGFDQNSFTSNASDDSAPSCSSGPSFNCFQPSLFGRYGTAPRSICCGPGLNNSDISLQKNTQITERMRVEFRWDVFNLANQPNFSTPMAMSPTVQISVV